MEVWGSIPYFPLPLPASSVLKNSFAYGCISPISTHGVNLPPLCQIPCFSSKIIANRYSVYLQNPGGFQSQDPNYNKTLFPKESTFSFSEFEYGHVLRATIQPTAVSFYYANVSPPKKQCESIKKKREVIHTFFFLILSSNIQDTNLRFYASFMNRLAEMCEM